MPIETTVGAFQTVLSLPAPQQRLLLGRAYRLENWGRPLRCISRDHRMLPECLPEVTECLEAVLEGALKVSGIHSEWIMAEAARLVADEAVSSAMAQQHDRYGDGHATGRIAETLGRYWGCAS
jgi:hypothetical protein